MSTAASGVQITVFQNSLPAKQRGASGAESGFNQRKLGHRVCAGALRHLSFVRGTRKRNGVRRADRYLSHKDGPLGCRRAQRFGRERRWDLDWKADGSLGAGGEAGNGLTTGCAVTTGGGASRMTLGQPEHIRSVTFVLITVSGSNWSEGGVEVTDQNQDQI